MGKRSAAKANQPPPSAPDAPKRSSVRLALAGFVVLGISVAGFAYWRSSQAESQAAAPQLAQLPANLKPHPQEHLPTLEFPGYPMAGSPEAVTAAYRFAAEHPEVLSYLPCYCGCERSGHRGNEDCFVQARDVNGDVIQWNDHGMECAVCLEVATKAMQMHGAGSSVSDIRAAIEREWSPRASSHTPTPLPPAK
jgi:hypothetical protein